MKPNTFTKALLALAGTTLLTTAAHASVPYATAGLVTSEPNNDLILSVYDTSSTTDKITLDYQVDIGQASTFMSASPSFTSLNLSADLTSVFGSFASNPNIVYSIAGTEGSTKNFGYNAQTIFVSDSTGTAFGALKGSALGTPAGNISKLYSPDAPGQTTAPVAGLDGNSAKVSISNSNSFPFAAGTGGYGETFNTESHLGVSAALDELASGSNALAAGSSTLDPSGDLFLLSDDGIFSFGPEASDVPEPSTYALMALGGLALLARRRKASRI